MGLRELALNEPDGLAQLASGTQIFFLHPIADVGFILCPREAEIGYDRSNEC